MSKDTDIVASTHTIKTIAPMLSEGERKYLYRELRDILSVWTHCDRAPCRKSNCQSVEWYKGSQDEALAKFFQVEGNTV